MQVTMLCVCVFWFHRQPRGNSTWQHPSAQLCHFASWPWGPHKPQICFQGNTEVALSQIFKRSFHVYVRISKLHLRLFIAALLFVNNPSPHSAHCNTERLFVCCLVPRSHFHISICLLLFIELLFWLGMTLLYFTIYQNVSIQQSINNSQIIQLWKEV